MATTQPRQGSGRGGLGAAVVRTHGGERAIDGALLLVRLVLAWVFVYYGAGKLFGWFDVGGLDVAKATMDEAGLRPVAFFAVAAGLLELSSAIAMALGFLARLAGLALAIDMVMAMITITGAKGTSSYGVNLALAGLAIVVVLLGAGRYSVDAQLERRLDTPDAAS